MKLRFIYQVIAALGLAVGCGGSLFSPGPPDGGSAAASGAGGANADAGTGAAGGASGAGGTSGGVGGSSGGTGGAGGANAGGSGAGRGGAAGAGQAGTSAAGGTSGAAGTSVTGGASGAGGAGRAGSAGGSGAGGAGTGGFDAGTGGSGTGGAGMGDSGIDWGTCSGGGTCVAVRKGCCDPCGMPEVDSFAGVNVAHVEVFKAETCPVPMPCPKCPTIVNPNIAARCVNNRCQAFDVGKVPEFSACSFDSDCRLRGGLACCEPCSSDLWVALNVSSEMALRSAVCNGPIACPPCIPIPPAGMRPVCKTGYCAVEPPCSLAPRIGCCFSDTHCAIGRCYAAAACTAGSEGMCKVRANQNECWGDRDCGPGLSCKGVSICPCGVTCIAPDKPGVCG